MAGTAAIPGFHGLSRKRSSGWSGSLHRHSQAFQRPLQRLERQRSQAFQRRPQRLQPQFSQAFTGFLETAPTVGTAALAGFHRLSEGVHSGLHRLPRLRNGWSGTVKGFTEAVPTVGTAALTGFHRLSQAFQKAFQRLERQRSQAFQRRPQRVGAAVFTGFPEADGSL